jgi:hypothetical protein
VEPTGDMGTSLHCSETSFNEESYFWVLIYYCGVVTCLVTHSRFMFQSNA